MPSPHTFDPSTLQPLTDRTILITGGTAGLGAATAAHLATLNPARLIITGRNAAAADAVLARLRAAHPGTAFEFARIDLADLAGVRDAAAALARRLPVLDALVCNAGIMAVPGATTAQGTELQLGVNHVAHALLVAHLLPSLRAAQRPARVVLLTSQGYALHPAGGIAFGAARSLHGGCGHGWWARWVRYGQSKLANLLYARALADRESGLCVVAVHPGIVRENGLVSALDWRSRWLVAATTVGKTLSPAQGGLSAAWAVAAERSDVVSGAYYEPVGQKTEVVKEGGNGELADRLWEWTQHEIGPWL